jgi:outer membrane protein assembly factor BamB
VRWLPARHRLHRIPRALAALIALFLTVASGCSARPDVERVALAVGGERVALEVAWRVRVGQPEPFVLRRRELGGTALSPDQRTLVVTTATGSVLALDTVDGSVRWRVSIGSAVDVVPVFDGMHVLLALSDGTLRSLHIADGREAWRYTAPTVFVSRPAVGMGIVVVHGNDGRLHAVDASSGRGLWTVERPRATDLSIHGACTPLISEDGVYSGFVDGSFLRISLEGRVVWTADLTDGHRRLADADAAPVRVGGVVYAASFAGGVFALDAEDGSVRWRADQTGASDLLVVADRLVFSDALGALVHLSRETGAEVARIPLDHVAAGSPVRVDPLLLVPTRQSGVLLVDATHPWIHARFEPDTGFHAAPAPGDGVFYAISDDEWVYAVRFGLYRPSVSHYPGG